MVLQWLYLCSLPCWEMESVGNSDVHSLQAQQSCLAAVVWSSRGNMSLLNTASTRPSPSMEPLWLQPMLLALLGDQYCGQWHYPQPISTKVKPCEPQGGTHQGQGGLQLPGASTEAVCDTLTCYVTLTLRNIRLSEMKHHIYGASETEPDQWLLEMNIHM